MAHPGICGSADNDHQTLRPWRHLDICQLRTILNTDPPRSNYPKDGVRTVKLPWAEPAGRSTVLFEALAIDWLSAASQQAAANRLQLSRDEVHAIQERAVQPGLERCKAEPVTRLGIDEKSFTGGHHYFTMVNDLDRSRVLFVAAHPTTQSLDEFWSSLTAKQIDAVRAVAMDMRDPYVTSTLDYLPEAQSKIVFNKIHIAKHLKAGETILRTGAARAV